MKKLRPQFPQPERSNDLKVYSNTTFGKVDLESSHTQECLFFHVPPELQSKILEFVFFPSPEEEEPLTEGPVSSRPKTDVSLFPLFESCKAAYKALFSRFRFFNLETLSKEASGYFYYKSPTYEKNNFNLIYHLEESGVLTGIQVMFPVKKRKRRKKLIKKKREEKNRKNTEKDKIISNFLEGDN